MGAEFVAVRHSIADGEWSEAEGGLLLRVKEGVAYATFNRPEARNPMATPIRLALSHFLDRIKHDRGIRVLVLQGAGKSFVAGGDVKSFAQGREMSGPERGADMESRAAGAGVLSVQLASLPQPVVVAARGPAAGYGASMIYVADFVILSDTARITLSHIGINLVPDGGATWYLPRIVGPKRAAQIAMLGDAMLPDEALATGIATQVVPDAELEAAAEALARRLAAAPQAALTEIKQLLRASFETSLPAQANAEAAAIGRCVQTEDYIEGLSALLEKRRPRFGATRT
jgi:2-(1,2-epoxy-1,2-dihydrophenyl)acetyl-CoA isomerase